MRPVFLYLQPSPRLFVDFVYCFEVRIHYCQPLFVRRLFTRGADPDPVFDNPWIRSHFQKICRRVCSVLQSETWPRSDIKEDDPDPDSFFSCWLDPNRIFREGSDPDPVKLYPDSQLCFLPVYIYQERGKNWGPYYSSDSFPFKKCFFSLVVTSIYTIFVNTSSA